MPVVCLHSSAASGKQWRRLVAEGGDAWAWHTPDFYGHGDRPAWPELMPSHLAVEAHGVLAGLPFATDRPFHLVGHSYGGAVALQVALQQPQRVLSLTLYEPVAFGVLSSDDANDEPALTEIHDVAARVNQALDQGDLAAAARGFCGYWQGRDNWAELGGGQQSRLAEAMPTVRRHFDALFTAPWSDRDLATLRMPVRLLCGSETRLSAQRVARTLAERLPQAQLTWLEGAGHLAPLSEVKRVNALLMNALGQVAATMSA